MSILLQNRFSIEDCSNHPDRVFIFGDDLIQKGKGGQAIIRDCHNAYSIPTNFNDGFDEYEAVKLAIEKLVIIKYSREDVTFVFPTDGLGTGLAQMKTKSPKLFKYMNEQLNKHFGVGYE